MSKPLHTFRSETKRGIKIDVWEKGRFSVTKSYFKKNPGSDSGEWKETNSFFENELVELKKLIDLALHYSPDDVPYVAPEINLDPQTKPLPFDDDDIGF